MGQGHMNREVVWAWWYSSWPRTARWADALSWWCSTGCPATTFISSQALSEANATGSLCRLTDWLSGPVARTHSGWCGWHWRMWSTWLWLLTLTILLSSASATSQFYNELRCLVSGSKRISPCWSNLPSHLTLPRLTIFFSLSSRESSRGTVLKM